MAENNAIIALENGNIAAFDHANMEWLGFAAADDMDPLVLAFLQFFIATIPVITHRYFIVWRSNFVARLRGIRRLIHRLRAIQLPPLLAASLNHELEGARHVPELGTFLFLSILSHFSWATPQTPLT